MGQSDFDYGWNEESEVKTDDKHDPPTYAQACFGMLVCPHCGKAVMCSDLPDKGATHMDVSGMKGKGSNTRLPWLDAETIPDKGTKLKVDAVREPRQSNKKSATVAYLDITNQADKKKYTWGIRKGFTLDALIDLLGTETDDWVGKLIPVVRGGSEGQYVNVAP